MNALLLDGSPTGDQQTAKAAGTLAAELEGRGYVVDRRRLAELDVRACTGCFGCWVKTPGECLIADDARALAAAIIASDVYAVVTPVRFGSYGSLAKSAIDRTIPLILPFFKKIDGEIHHGQRYQRFPRYVALGTSWLTHEALDDEAAAFGTLVSRNAINLHCPSHASALVGSECDVASAAAGMLDEALETQEVAA